MHNIAGIHSLGVRLRYPCCVVHYAQNAVEVARARKDVFVQFPDMFCQDQCEDECGNGDRFPQVWPTLAAQEKHQQHGREYHAEVQLNVIVKYQWGHQAHEYSAQSSAKRDA